MRLEKRFSTVKAKLRLAFASAIVLVLPPVIAASIHIHRMSMVNQELAQVELRLSEQSATTKSHVVPLHIKKLLEQLALASDQAYRDVLTLSALSLFVLLTMTILLPEHIIRPLKRLTAFFRQVEGGNLNVGHAMVTPDEVGALAQRVNQVLHELHSFDELKRAKIVTLVAQRDDLLKLLARPIALLDGEGRVMKLSRQFCELFGVEETALLHQELVVQMGWPDPGLRDALCGHQHPESLQLPLRWQDTTYQATIHSYPGDDEHTAYRLLLVSSLYEAATS